MNIISAACLLVLAVICLFGVFSSHYKDNWAQFVGLWGMIAWSLARSWQLIDDGGSVTTQQLVAHVSITIFALGTAWKVARHKRAAEPISQEPVSDDELRQIYGGKGQS